MSTVYRFRLKCLTDNQDKFVWGTSPPTVCPTNSAHTIDTSSITIVDEISSELVQVKEEDVPTGGNFQATTLKLTCVPNTVSTISTYWPFNVTAFGVNFVTASLHKGDIMNMYAGKDSIVGAIMAPVVPASAWVSGNYTAGQTVTYTHPTFGERVYTCILDTVSNETPLSTLHWRHGFKVTVSPTVIEHTQVGYYLKLNDFTNSDELNRVISIDATNSSVYVETNPANSYSPLTPPTYIQQTAYLIKDFEIGDEWARNIGEMKIGGSHIPADTMIEVAYENKSVSETKYLIGHVEYLY